MKVNNFNYVVTKELIIKSIEKWIDYVNNYCTEYKEYFDDMEKANTIFKQDPEKFKTEVIENGFFEKKRYYDFLNIAIDVLKNIDIIHINIINTFISPTEIVYPVKMQKWLYYFKNFCYDENDKILSLQEQEEQSKQQAGQHQTLKAVMMMTRSGS